MYKRTKGENNNKTKGQKYKGTMGQQDNGTTGQKKIKTKNCNNIFEVLCCILGMCMFSFSIFFLGKK